MVLLAELIQNNKNMRSISMQRINLTEVSAFPLVESLSNSLNIESLNFDFNNLGPTFIRNLVDRLISNKRIDNVKAGQINSPQSRSSSIMTDETFSNGNNSLRNRIIDNG